MNYYTSVSAKIKNLREKKNMTQSELAEGICSVSHISRIENGTRSPNTLILRQISNKLGITLETLLRSVESRNSIRIYELISELRHDMEYNRFEKVYKVTSAIDIDKIYSLEDKQIILILNCLSENAIKSIPKVTITKLQDILDMSYSNGIEPTDVEFAIMTELTFCYIKVKELEKAKEIVAFLEGMTEKVFFHRIQQPLIKFYINSSILAYLEKDYENAHICLDKAISCAKDLCFHVRLIECYYAKARIFEKQGMKEKATLWHENSKLLVDLLFDLDTEYYEINIDSLFDLNI